MIRRMMSLLAVFGFASLAMAAGEMQVQVTTLDGVEVTGVLTAWTTQGLTVAVEGEPLDIAAEQLLAVRKQQSSSSSSEAATARLQLVDGTLFPLTSITITDHQATATTPFADEPLTISTDEIRLLQFAPFEERVTKLWSELAEKPLGGDVLIVHKKKRTTLDYLTGLLGDVSSKQVAFNFEGETIPVKRSKVAALAYFHARQPKYPAAVCWLKTHDGALLPVKMLPVRKILWEQETLRVTTVGGYELHLPFDSVLEADYSIGKITYLSDLQPVRQQWTPRIEFPESAKLIRAYGIPRRNQSFTGSALTLRWPALPKKSSRSQKNKSTRTTYRRGLAIRSRTILEYRLPPQMQRFVAIAGIDPATADQGNVHLEISSGDQILWQGEIEGTAPPVEIEVELGGTRQLRILVDYGSNLDFGDRLHLVEARVTK